MKTTQIIWSAIAALAIGSSYAFSDAKVGEAAPDFTLKDLDGKEHKLSDQKGKFVVLEWINHGCPWVKKQYDPGNMQKLQKEYGAKDVVWYSVSTFMAGKGMPAEKWKKISAEKGAAPAAVLLDEDGTVGRKYGAKTTPHMFVIDAKGTLVYHGAIDSLKDKDRERNAPVENYVKGCLDAVMAGKASPYKYKKPYGCGVKYPKKK